MFPRQAADPVRSGRTGKAQAAAPGYAKGGRVKVGILKGVGRDIGGNTGPTRSQVGPTRTGPTEVGPDLDYVDIGPDLDYQRGGLVRRRQGGLSLPAKAGRCGT
jgi:hypothetical protein